jgi:anti-sigma regulatory factor (Ser/Thr protein kinase)
VVGIETAYDERAAIAARPGSSHKDARLQTATQRRVRERARKSQLRLRLSASPEEVPFARIAITRLCEHLELDDQQTQNVRLAVTEACSNCVLHAYEGTTRGTYVLDARVDHQALRVTVCDSGVGVDQPRASIHPDVGYGLHLIQTLADSAEISSPPSGGTRIVMRFAMCA